ncbi:hypothetical protein AMJ57_03045 [Parcubacteria bacterium SG8_24]|nr:MAG: hypothetical protein AMJ57_03045 [Parcubacteria bacterium SG8_24]
MSRDDRQPERLTEDHGHPTHDGTAVLELRPGRKTDASPHLLDLNRHVSAEEYAAVKARRKMALRQLLDEHLHLHDMRVRTLSVRPRGWRDFPPPESVTLWQAVRITVVRFFNEHPLADLTVLTLLQITFILAWRLALKPAGIFRRRRPARRSTLAAPAFLTDPDRPPTDRELLPLLQPISLGFERPPGWRGALLGFAAIAVLLILPIGAYGSLGGLKRLASPVIEQGSLGVSMLHAAGSAAQRHDFDEAQRSFRAAEAHFAAAKEKLGKTGRTLLTAGAFIPVEPLASAAPMLTAGEEIARGGIALTSGLSHLDTTAEPTTRLRLLSGYLTSSLPHLDAATEAIRRVSASSIPEAHRSVLLLAKREMPILTDDVRRGADIAELLAIAFGADEPKRYLVIFQNDAELRPTGGFIGSFALVDVNRGEIQNLDIPGGGSYDLQGSLRARLISPRPLHLINPHWQFQDANWSPDFPTSADRLAWFYEQSGGPTVDGVIAITTSFMERLIGITGPIDLPEYDKVIDADNFYLETQTYTELEYDKEENRPKQIIADMAPIVLERVLEADRQGLLEMIDLFDRSLTNKDLQFWFADDGLQTQAAELGWTGELQPADGDYLYVVHTNIAGQKTDRVMEESIRHETKILPDSTAIITLTLTRAHHGRDGEPFSGVRNVDYLRVYVPQGSLLIDAAGFTPPSPTLFELPEPGYVTDETLRIQEETTKIHRDSGTRIWQENGKTVFGNWVQTDPGETSVATLVYQLPPGAVTVERVSDDGLDRLINAFTQEGGSKVSYSLLVQKQAGANPPGLIASVDFPRGYYPIWQSRDLERDDRGRWNASMTLEGDAMIGVMAHSPH